MLLDMASKIGAVAARGRDGKARGVHLGERETRF